MKNELDAQIGIDLHYSFTVLCDNHDIDIFPCGIYVPEQFRIKLPKSGKAPVRADLSIPKGSPDPNICRKILDVLKEDKMFEFGMAFAIVSTDCLKRLDNLTSQMCFAPGKKLKGDNGCLYLKANNRFVGGPISIGNWIEVVAPQISRK